MDFEAQGSFEVPLRLVADETSPIGGLSILKAFRGEVDTKTLDECWPSALRSEVRLGRLRWKEWQVSLARNAARLRLATCSRDCLD
jgi:hypothetical protein